MEALYQEFRDIAEFSLVYIREAHAADGRRPTPYAKQLGIKEHLTTHDRCTTAQEMLKNKSLTIPCYADAMDDRINSAYQAWPDRLYVIRSDGRLAIVAEPGPRGFEPALKTTRKWLEEFRENAQEPKLPPSASKPGPEREVPGEGKSSKDG